MEDNVDMLMVYQTPKLLFGPIPMSLPLFDQSVM